MHPRAPQQAVLSFQTLVVKKQKNILLSLKNGPSRQNPRKPIIYSFFFNRPLNVCWGQTNQAGICSEEIAGAGFLSDLPAFAHPIYSSSLFAYSSPDCHCLPPCDDWLGFRGGSFQVKDRLVPELVLAQCLFVCLFVCLLKASSLANRTGSAQGCSPIQILHMSHKKEFNTKYLDTKTNKNSFQKI